MSDPMTQELSAAQRAEVEFDLQAAREELVERLRNQMTFAEKALAAMMLANGGALIALFTFIGNTVGKSDAPLKFSTSYLWGGFALFSLGVALVLVTHLFAFFSQFNFYNQAGEELWRHQRTLRTNVFDTDTSAEEAENRRGNTHLSWGIATLICSLVCFLGGAGLSLAGVLPA